MPRTKKPQRIQKPKIFPKDNILNNEKALFEEITVRELEERKQNSLFKFEETFTTIDSLFKSFTMSLKKKTLNQSYEKFVAEHCDLKNFNEGDLFVKIFHNEIIKDDVDKPLPVKRTKRTNTKNKTVQAPIPAPPIAQHFLTPATNQKGKLNPITPKIEPNTALTVLRHPRHGEIGISINGSPLLVSSNHNQDLANVNIPLQDGNIISLIGQAGNVNLKNVTIDNKTKEQLKIIQRNLDIILEEQ